MSMFKTFNEQQKLQTATQVIYDNVQFPNGFRPFLEALVIESITTKEPSSSPQPGGYVWLDEVASGGIKLVTTSHPYLHQLSEQVIFEGQRDELDIIQNLLTRHGVIYEGSAQNNIEVKVEYHSTLNPILWEQVDDETYEMLPEIQEALEHASEAFYDYLELPDLPIEDIVITGSSANFNWTDSSDLDLHIVVDMKKAEKKYGKLVVEYFDAEKKLWNDTHDISIKGIPIEFYIQATDEKHDSTGVYSLKEEEWIITPTHEPPSVDSTAVKAKASEWMKKIDKCVKYCTKPDDFEKLMVQLRKMRKAGLSEAGEFSTENLAFKILRNKGYVDKLADAHTEAFDKELSIEDEEWDEEKDDPWADIGYIRPQPKEPTKQSRTRLNLNVPYAHRDAAKRAGARWDPGIRKWYMMVTTDDLKRIPSSWR